MASYVFFKIIPRAIKCVCCNYAQNVIQSKIPFLSIMQYQGCSSIVQFVAVETLAHLGISLKVIGIIILFL
jgi:hypothetical protein